MTAEVIRILETSVEQAAQAGARTLTEKWDFEGNHDERLLAPRHDKQSSKAGWRRGAVPWICANLPCSRLSFISLACEHRPVFRSIRM